MNNPYGITYRVDPIALNAWTQANARARSEYTRHTKCDDCSAWLDKADHRTIHCQPCRTERHNEQKRETYRRRKDQP